ncbi:uncharacterized mitochondrial protein AtMg00810-like [Lathyrus oleraceus]|uniref:uncharacterized mitochondrial protein AtMg00810-like n=1 Tax=Pisum sativum TaxID=3888 RepID=UPI0021D1CD82|nr:uncharacterized mitochondrial protein AtMg00810-like [Pisum sativum]
MEYGVYVQHTSDINMILMCIYVDDILLTGSCSDEIVKFKKVLMNAFGMSDLGNMVYFLRMEVLYSDKGIIFHQLKYELDLLNILELINCKSAITPTETIHKLDYDDEVKIVSRFMNKPKWSHYQVVIRILRYIKGSQRVDRRSASRYFFKYLGGPISWCSKKQLVVALSTCEAEYIAGALSACQAV